MTVILSPSEGNCYVEVSARLTRRSRLQSRDFGVAGLTAM
jgi:hypothetical protein